MPAITIVIPEPTPTPEPSPHLIEFHDGSITAADFLAALGLNREWVEVGKAVVAMGLISFIVLCIFLLVRCCMYIDEDERRQEERKKRALSALSSSTVPSSTQPGASQPSPQDDVGQTSDDANNMDDCQNDSNKETGDAQPSAVQNDKSQSTNSSSMDDHESESDTDEKTYFFATSPA
ncbi:hypothetical protein PG991_014435 [Apiospora marii]|uniref:Uncharacterized protein n=1 Tax=Apiospora marii TaxID=335849 RepID=A0ABR1R903_9PEZI